MILSLSSTKTYLRWRGVRRAEAYRTKKEQDAEKSAEVMHLVPTDWGRNFSPSVIAKAGGDESHEKSIRSFIVRNSLDEQMTIGTPCISTCVAGTILSSECTKNLS
jgi:hypothetical protein